MTIRSTVNESIISDKKHHASINTELPVSEAIEHVFLNNAATGGEQREVDTPPLGGTSTQPAYQHNGTRE